VLHSCTIADCGGALAYGDSNRNGVRDGCDIAEGTSLDANADPVPDECQAIVPFDGNGDGIITVDDGQPLGG